MTEHANSAPKPKSSWINLAIDYGPLLVFFLTYRHFAPSDDADQLSQAAGQVVAVTKSTLAFMGATIAALAISKWRLGRVSPMLWLSTVLVLGFGSITVYLGDPWYIERKPTAIYLLFAIILFGGLMRGKAILKVLLEAAFDGLNEEGWLKLSRNWAFFFVILAILNEAVLLWLGIKYPPLVNGNQNPAVMDLWLKAKLWLFTPLSFLFTFAQIPMLMRHGLAGEAETEVEQNPPHD